MMRLLAIALFASTVPAFGAALDFVRFPKALGPPVFAFGFAEPTTSAVAAGPNGSTYIVGTVGAAT